MDQNSFIIIHQIRWHHWESVAGTVIQATRTVDFEDCLRTGVLPGGCWYPLAALLSPGSILHPGGDAGWSWGRCGCQKDLC